MFYVVEDMKSELHALTIWHALNMKIHQADVLFVVIVGSLV